MNEIIFESNLRGVTKGISNKNYNERNGGSYIQGLGRCDEQW